MYVFKYENDTFKRNVHECKYVMFMCTKICIIFGKGFSEPCSIVGYYTIFYSGVCDDFKDLRLVRGTAWLNC